MTRGPQKMPRVTLFEEDRATLVGVAELYEQAVRQFAVADETPKTGPNARLYRDRLRHATVSRERAVRRLIDWANKTLVETEGMAGYPVGSNHPRIRKGYDHSYSFRKWGHGSSTRAAQFLRAVAKRGWL